MKKTVTIIAAAVLAAGSARAQLQNGNIELWRSVNAGTGYEVPQNWYSIDSIVAQYAPALGLTAKKQVYKTTDKHGGTYAAMLVSRIYGGFGVVPGAIANAKIDLNPLAMTFTRTGGSAVTSRVSSASAWVKYIPKTTADSGTMALSAVLSGRGAGGADSVVGSGQIVFGATSAYTQVTATVTYINATVVPDHFQVGFTSSTFQSPGAGDSSVLYVDDVVFASPSGVSRVLFNADVVHVYPNPADNVLYLSSKEKEQLTWEALTADGRLVAGRAFTQSAVIPLDGMASGLYFFRVMNAAKELVQTGKFIIK